MVCTHNVIFHGLKIYSRRGYQLQNTSLITQEGDSTILSISIIMSGIPKSFSLLGYGFVLL